LRSQLDEVLLYDADEGPIRADERLVSMPDKVEASCDRLMPAVNTMGSGVQ
jgi:hypothetical protein